jgi:hypothetical protein
LLLLVELLEFEDGYFLGLGLDGSDDQQHLLDLLVVGFY